MITGSPILTLHDPATSQRYYAAGFWRSDTLYTLLADNAARHPERPALRDGARRLGWGELLREVDRVAGALAAKGLRRGARVAVWLPNRVEKVIVFLACSRNGYVCNASLHQNYTVAEIVALLQRTAACALFAQPGFGADAAAGDIFTAARDAVSLRAVYAVEPQPGPAGARAATTGLRWPGASEHAAGPVDRNPDKIVCLAFTSGTTGVPKGVLHSDNTLLANARALIQDWRHPADTVLLCLSPMSHAIGTIAMSQALVGGFELVLNSPPPQTKPLDWVLETGATYVMGVPTHAIDLLAEMRRRGLERMGRVRVFYMGGSAIAPEVVETFLAKGIRSQNIYGMTENGAHQYTRPDDDIGTITRTCGRCATGYDVRIWKADDPDTEASPGEIGEIGGRGACLMLGYFSDQAATEEAFNRDGWFMSGDLGRLDDKGCLHIVGRKKDIIIRGGRNIYPIRIEALAGRHPDVLRVAAFPVPDKRLGERVCLAVVPRDGCTVSGDAMLAFLHIAGLSKYDMPEYFVSLSEFPLTPSGKIMKRDLVTRVQSGRLQPIPVRWVEPKAGRAG